MEEDKKLLRFEKLVWDEYSQGNSFDKLRHNFIRTREIMIEQHESFNNFPAQKQFDYCVTIIIIALQSTRQDLNKLRMFSKPKNNNYEYSINEGFVKPVPIEISGIMII